MKFVDEALIHVKAGRGGHGCLSFRREKYVAKGGPNGGNGGHGGDVWLQAKASLNTLVDFRYQHHHRAGNGETGSGRLKTGACGATLKIPVPLGTQVHDVHTGELIGELMRPDQCLLVARGGRHGFGNAHFKSSVNRAPRETTQGEFGEERDLKLSLSVLADVGLLGLPNAGKSTLIRAVSNAQPKVADYPFTTTHPHLGVIRMDAGRSFVMADIPGLVAGAASGVGLGDRFLKHVARTRVLLHVIDLSLSLEDIVQGHHDIVEALQQFSPELIEKPRWLVLNKCDLVSDDVEAKIQAVKQAIHWQGSHFAISGLARMGTTPLCHQLMQHIESLNAESPI